MKYIVDTYILEYSESENKYYITFKNSIGKNCKIEISKAIFEEYMKSKRSYKKIENNHSRYEEYSELTEISLYNRSKRKEETVEEKILHNITKEQLKLAKEKLTETQIRRIESHYIEKISIRDLAKLEGVRKNQIEKSIQLGLKKLKKFLNN